MEKMLHAYILSGGFDATAERAWHMAAAALCESRTSRPCGVCRHCRKAAERIHPDITVVERQIDPKTGKLRKEIVVEQIRALIADASILPNEASGKVYIFPAAHELNGNAQNAFLKLLEEPPRGVTFLLCTENPAGLLPTVRSRCAEVRLASGTDADAEAEARASGFLDARQDRVALLRYALYLEKLDARALADVLACIAAQAVRQVPDVHELLALEKFIAQARSYLDANVGVKFVTGFLSTYIYDRK